MRRILVQHARMHNAEKRGGKLEKLYLDETRELSQERQPDLVALDDALQSFAATYSREAMVVELKFFLADWRPMRSRKCSMFQRRPFCAIGILPSSGSVVR